MSRKLTSPFIAAILYYDYFLTFNDEYWRIWRRPKNIGAILFFVNRYLAILGVGLAATDQR